MSKLRVSISKFTIIISSGDTEKALGVALFHQMLADFDSQVYGGFMQCSFLLTEVSHCKRYLPVYFAAD